MIIGTILLAAEEQKILEKPKIEDIAVNITLIDGDILYFCFITSENEDFLSIVETTSNGMEKIRILSKDSIVKIAVLYADDILVEKKEKEKELDKMVI